jgi:hypothetical protein
MEITFTILSRSKIGVVPSMRKTLLPSNDMALCYNKPTAETVELISPKI